MELTEKDILSFKHTQLTWRCAYRIIPSRFPPIQLFERVTDPDDLEAVLALESLTNERILDEVGELQLVPKGDRLCGPGTSAIMAAFTHRNPNGSRFSDGSWGVYYCAKSLQTAIEETCYHTEKFYRDSRVKQTVTVDMRVLVATVRGSFVDIRNCQARLTEVYDKEDYAAGQSLARQLKKRMDWGIVYRSVRDSDGECLAVFRPPALSQCRQSKHLCYVWNGQQIESVFEKKLLKKRTIPSFIVA